MIFPIAFWTGFCDVIRGKYSYKCQSEKFRFAITSWIYSCLSFSGKIWRWIFGNEPHIGWRLNSIGVSLVDWVPYLCIVHFIIWILSNTTEPTNTQIPSADNLSFAANAIDDAQENKSNFEVESNNQYYEFIRVSTRKWKIMLTIYRLSSVTKTRRVLE